MAQYPARGLRGVSMPLPKCRCEALIDLNLISLNSDLSCVKRRVFASNLQLLIIGKAFSITIRANSKKAIALHQTG